MTADVGLGELLWSLLVLFIMVQYLIILFAVIMDVFRSDDLKGISKALWFIFLLFVPLVSLIVYLIARGDGMGMRSLERERRAREATDAYVRSAVPNPGGAAAEAQTAKSLVDSGGITAAEYEQLKSRILDGTSAPPGS